MDQTPGLDFVAVELAHHAAVPEDDRAIAEALELRLVRGADQNRNPTARRFVDQVVDLSLRRDVHPLVGSSSSKTAGSVWSHLPRTIFCWLPPDRASIGSLQRRSLDRHLAADLGCLATVDPSGDPTTSKELAKRGQVEVLSHVQPDDDAVAEPIGRNHGDSELRRSARSGSGELTAPNRDAALARFGAEDQ